MHYAFVSAPPERPHALPSTASRRLEPRLRVTPPLRPRPRHDPSRPSLTQFVALSIALHAFFILLFGSPTGGSREGHALWGGLQVTIRGPLMDPGIGLKLDTRPALALPGTQILEKRERREAPPPPPAKAVLRPAPDLESQRVSNLPAPDLLPAVVPTPPTADLAPAPRIETPRVEVPVVPVPSFEGTARPDVEPSLAKPVEVARPVRRRVAPVVPAAPAIEGAAPMAAPRLEQPVDVAPIPAPPPRPAPVPVISAPSLEDAISPAPSLSPSLAPPVDVKPVPRPAAPASPAPKAAAPQPEAAPAAPPRPSNREAGEIRREGMPPRADSPIFDRRREPPGDTLPPGSGPRIDLDAARARAREIAREGSGNRALLPFAMPPAPEKRTRMEEAIEKARKPDCKDAYKDMGLLAAIPLIANEFGEGNCRW
jgi:hypothetical protein